MISNMASKDDPSEDDELPEKWPDADALSSDHVRTIQVKNEESLQAYKNHLSKKSVSYPMKNFPRGNVLVINNERFPPPHQREGSEKDCQKITAVFNQLGFNVNVHNNLIKEEMEKVLIQASRQDYSNHDCFILFILSHGDKGVVHGIDNNSLSISYIRKLFCDNKWLVGKPKLFFIQACQGGGYDKGKTLEDEASTCGHSEVEAPIKQLEQSDSRHVQLVNSCDEMSEGEEITDGSRIPSEADTFVSLATVKGYASWRNTKCGSWYIQAIGYIFRMFAYKNDLNHLMILVNNLVSKCETKSHQYKQVATTNSTLTKTFYFFPCLHEPYVEIINKYGQESFQRQSLQEEMDSVCLELKTVTGQLDHEKSTRVNLKNELVTMTEQRDSEKILKESLETELETLSKRYGNIYFQLQGLQKEIDQLKENTVNVCSSASKTRENVFQNPRNTHPSGRARTDFLLTDTTDIDLLMIGKTGNGKSALGNTILRRKAFVSKCSFPSVTEIVAYEYSEFNGRIIHVVDGPGVGDTRLNTEKNMKIFNDAMQNAIAIRPRGYHVFLLVIKYGQRFTEEDRDTIAFLKKIFGESFVKKFCILVMTNGDLYKLDSEETGLTFKEWCAEQEGVFTELLNECDGRIVLFNNRAKDEREKMAQLSELIKMVDNLS